MLQIFDGVVFDNFDVLFLAPVSLLLKYIYIFFFDTQIHFIPLTSKGFLFTSLEKCLNKQFLILSRYVVFMYLNIMYLILQTV